MRVLGRPVRYHRVLMNEAIRLYEAVFRATPGEYEPIPYSSRKAMSLGVQKRTIAPQIAYTSPNSRVRRW